MGETNMELEQGSSTEVETTSTPTVEELMKQLASEQAMNKRYKLALDKATNEVAENKRQLKAKLTADEQAQAEALEKQRRTEEELAELKRTIALSETSKRFMALSMDEAIASRASDALIDGDMDSLFQILGEHINSIRTGAEQRFLASRPNITAGSGTSSTVSQKEFDSMSYMDRLKLFEENPSLYESLNK